MRVAYGTIHAVRKLLACLIGLASLGPCANGFAQTRDVQRALVEARALESAGNPAAALAKYRWALDASSPRSAEHARALLGLATIETAQGKYADARRHSADAARLFDDLGDGAQGSLAMNRQGLIALNAADYDEAGRMFAAAIERSARAGYLEGRTEQLGNLANVQFYVGRYADAERLYGEALSLTSTAPPDASWVPRRNLLLRVNQASLWQRLGRDQEALAVYREFGSSAILRPREQAQMLVNLGVLYRRLGDPVKALDTYDDAIALFAHDHDVDDELNTVKNRGIVLALDLNRLAEAERSFTSALETATRLGNRREMLHDRLYRAETRLRLGNEPGAREDFDAGLALSRELHTPEEEWKALYGMGRVAVDHAKAIAYFEQAVKTIEDVREAIRVPLLRTEFLNDKREVYDALIAASLPGATPEAVFRLLERSHARVWRERLRLDKPVELSQIQAALPERTLLLDYWNGPAASAVVAVSRARAAVLSVTADEAEIRGLVDLLAGGPSARWRDLSRRVGSHLLPPPDWFRDVDRVVIVPDGVMSRLPFDVLSTGDRLLVEFAAVTSTPTATTLVRSTPVRSWLPPWRLQVRAFADPVGGQSAGGRPRLPASAGEARRVADELGGRAVLHLAEDNRKAYLLGSSERAPILHLATHAVADASALERSHILFSSPDPGSDASDYLFLREAYALKLDGVNLAVLSACETESGRLVRGEGIQSFSRAFLAAGAQSTVTTMWRVADEPTADFMQVFYHHLGRGEPRDQALRHAKLRFVASESSLSDPHYWAAFSLTGDGFHPVPRAITWRMIAAAASALAIAAFAIARTYRRTKSVPR
jgi:tetratricopeptide (TPR) repeat protein